VRAGRQKKYYSNVKIREALEMEFIPVSESILRTAEIFLKEFYNNLSSI